MSQRDPRERFDYKSWFERNVAKRTVAALEARDAAFAEKHADTPLEELAQYLVKLGAESAVNFDGGGSSEMVINGRIVNKPSDGRERYVSIGIGLFTK